MEKTQYTAAPPDTDKALYWYSILVKCARLLDLPDDEPIPSGVLRKVEELAALAAAPAQAEPSKVPTDYRNEVLEEAAEMLEQMRWGWDGDCGAASNVRGMKSFAG